MNIFIMRHGQAEELAGRDKDRLLTPRGQSDSLMMAEWLAEQGGCFDCALVSPYVRARQTFELVNSVLSVEEEQIQIMPELTPHGAPEVMRDYLHGLAAEGRKTILLVSHMPLVSFLVEQLDPSHATPMFATSAVARIEFDVGVGRGSMTALHSPAAV